MNQIVLITIVATVLVSLKGFKDHSFFEQYKFQVNKILNGDKLRMLSSGFLHADFTHLLFNMYALYLFGGIVASRLGYLNFLIIYLGSLLTGSMYSLYSNKKDLYYSAIGASGAVSGIMFSAIMLYPSKSYGFLFFPFIEFPGYVLGIGYLLYSIYGMKKQLGNIGHSAHLGGAIGGFALTLLIYPEIFSMHRTMILLLAIPIIGLLLFGDKLQKL